MEIGQEVSKSVEYRRRTRHQRTRAVNRSEGQAGRQPWVMEGQSHRRGLGHSTGLPGLPGTDLAPPNTAFLCQPGTPAASQPRQLRAALHVNSSAACQLELQPDCCASGC